MVMFHHEIPYSVAQQRGLVQSELLSEFTRDADTLAQIDLDTAAAAALERLAAL